jgi:cytochrome c biogenesis protein
MRETPADTFRYIRVPADAQGSMDDFVRLNGALHTPALRDLAVRRYAVKAAQGQKPELIDQIAASASRALALFAGAEARGGAGVAGLQAVSDFIEANVPETERNRAGEVLIRILNGTLYELAQVARERAKLPPLDTDARVQAFMTQAVLALSDVPLYPAPLVLTLADFTHVQASVFQVARAPGKTVVYLGCALLILGVFSMLYVRERRLWLWLAPIAGESGVQARLAYSTNRKTMDSDKEFSHLKARLLGQED